MNFLSKAIDWSITLGDFIKDYFLAIIRLYWGYSFFLSGWGKVGNIDTVAEFFNSVHIPLSYFNAYLVAYVETIGGLCLIIGLASRLVSIPLAITMIVALFTAHLTETMAAFDNPQRLINQLPFTYLLVMLVVLSFGPGRFSLDRLMSDRI